MEAESMCSYNEWQQMNLSSQSIGIEIIDEIQNKQILANFIQDIGQNLQLELFCINTALVFMHRFFMKQSFIECSLFDMATTCVVLAAEVHGQTRKMKHVVEAFRACSKNDYSPIDINSNEYIQKSRELIKNSNLLLQAIDYDLEVDPADTHVLEICDLFNIPENGTLHDIQREK